jgi:exodeoxyribonuclease VII small subunit
MPKNLESAMKELNQIVEKMEKGGSSLDESLIQFEQGISLIRYCQNSLKKAAQKIKLYMKEKNQLEPFNGPDESL